MTKYCDEVDTTNEKTHGKLINLIGKNKKVLEIGCTNGRMSKFLAKNGCQVTGIEIDSVRAQTSKQFCSEVIIVYVEDESVQIQIKGNYDAIIIADVL